ncbi:MAG: DNA-directed RNA polymerase subunit beta [candidate division WWE3 bacterium]|nr:DNA-directed RNA polymerase subunit beta [candidate division WWE3 bacterium]
MRQTFGEQTREILPLPNLSSIQRDSFDFFKKNGISEILDEVNPIKDNTGRNWEVSFESPRIDKPNSTIADSLKYDITFDAPWYLTVKLTDANTGKNRKQEIYMGDIPLMTEQGTFVINGVERAVINQLARSEGVLFSDEYDKATGARLAGAKILPKNGAWLEIETSKSGVLSVKIDRRRKLTITTLLRLFGLESNDKIRVAFKDIDTNNELSYIEKTLEKDVATSYNEALLEFYRKMRPGEPLVIENAKSLVEAMFFNPRRYSLGKVGRFRLNQKMGIDTPNDPEHRLLTITDLVKIVGRVIEMNNGSKFVDDTDSLANRRIRSVGELLQLQARVGFLQMERNIKERIALQPREELCDPAVLVSPRPVAARLHAFFASGQLSQFQEQTNPLAGLDHLRRLSVLGPGGLTRERASFSVRDAHYSHYGRICPTRTPEGSSIGLITYLALHARVNEYGFVETPYRKLKHETDGRVRVTEEVEFLAAYEEDKFYTTDTSVSIDSKGYITSVKVPLRKGSEFVLGDPKLASYIDVIAEQTVGLTTSLIPFLANDYIARALVGTQQASQAVPLVRPQAPIVGTGMEKVTSDNSGILLTASEAGVVTEITGETVVVTGKDSNKKKIYFLKKFVQSNMKTCYNQRVAVNVGDKVKVGSVLAEGPASENGELALGTNLKIAYMYWHGYGYEDAVIISSRLVIEDVLTSVHITDHTVQVLETKLGNEEVTADIPNASEESLRNLDENGIVIIGAKVKAGDILVGKIAPKGELELSAEERLLRAIFGEKAEEVRDNSLRMPHGEQGTVIGVKVLTKAENDELSTGVIKEIKVFVAQERKISVGDKLAGRHGNKGVIAKIVRAEDMPYTASGEPIDIILSPASMFSRMNLGQLYEAHLGACGVALHKNYEVPSFKHVSMETLALELKEAGLPVSGKQLLIDGQTGEFFDHESVVGSAYIFKLIHIAEDKMHARSTGPYSLITQQPLGGKAQFGGQRFGEMEVWALEAYGAAHTLQEMLTIKSDDLIGRTKAYRAILQNQTLPESAVPESFKLLVRELNGLGLKLETVVTTPREVIVAEPVISEETPVATPVVDKILDIPEAELLAVAET